MVVIFVWISIMMMIGGSLASSQFYQALNPNSFDLGNYNNPSLPDESASGFNANSNAQLDYIEKKFVNSGQSIVLICDLPNNMPDGKVSKALKLTIN